MAHASGHPSVARASVLPLFVILLSLLSFAQQTKVLAPHKPVAPLLPREKWPTERPVRRSAVGGLWMIDANFKSSIYLKNNVAVAPLTVTPILYLSNGKKYVLPDVKLKPSGTAVVSVNDGLRDLGLSPWTTLIGYVDIQYMWSSDAICVTITNVDTVHSLIFTYGIKASSLADSLNRQTDSFPSRLQVVEGMWWKHESNVTGFVALSNTLGEPINAKVQISDSAGQAFGVHTVTVSPHGTKLINLRELRTAVGSEGGIRVSYDGPSDALLVSGGLEDRTSGYSVDLGFLTTDKSSKPKKREYAEVGLMMGAADPMMLFPAGTVFTAYSVMRNVSDQPISVTPTLWWMEAAAAHSAVLPQLRLLPYQTSGLDVSALASGAGLKNFNGSINLVFDTEAKKHGLLLASGSVDQKNTYVFEAMPRHVGESLAQSLSYWSTGNGDDTMVTLWNPADETQDFVFDVVFEGGHYKHPVHLGPRATLMFNISEIVHSQIPDEDGNIIPANVQEGSATISGPRGESEHILVVMDVGSYNVRKATCTWKCIPCAGYTEGSVSPDPWDVGVGGSETLTALAREYSGNWYDVSSDATWYSGNTNIATVDYAYGVVHGVNAGSTNISWDAPDEPIGACETCGSPPSGCEIDCEGISGSGSGTVQQPTASRITQTLSSYALNSGQSPCASGYAGWYRQVQKIVTDQNGADIVLSGQNLSETITIGTPNDLGITGVQKGTAVTNANGNFNDTFYVCSAKCPGNSGQTDANQTISDKLPSGAGPYNLTPNSLVYKCTGITVNGQ
jgi:hypothetical protein